jgi:hypothetical protein
VGQQGKEMEAINSASNGNSRRAYVLRPIELPNYLLEPPVAVLDLS